MKNEILNEIIKNAIIKLQDEYGFAGLAQGEHFALINSTDKEGCDIKIKISIEQ